MGPLCPWCDREMVEVDNPMRREVRHRRGEEALCPGPVSADEQARRDEAFARFADALIPEPPGDWPKPTLGRLLP